ncbi:hypothetical protein [Paraburkholderia hayleyella]|uniref:hypothetical protein n=1 Tax=Paraburkholderia hayleyella TaxID=2152889 RepID=UPI001291A461|nr:hypothetical protein [Paraburkholderia hayleyella]
MGKLNISGAGGNHSMQSVPDRPANGQASRVSQAPAGDLKAAKWMLRGGLSIAVLGSVMLLASLERRTSNRYDTNSIASQVTDKLGFDGACWIISGGCLALYGLMRKHNINQPDLPQPEEQTLNQSQNDRQLVIQVNDVATGSDGNDIAVPRRRNLKESIGEGFISMSSSGEDG